MFQEYQERVVAVYDRRKKQGPLSPELMHPTPANLKAEVVKICEEGYAPKDELLLRSFAGQKKENAGAYRAAFQTGNAEVFKPLAKFLRERKTQPDERNIELLALLLNLEPRPYKPGVALPPIEPEADTDEETKPPIVDPPRRKALWIALIILALVAGAVYLLWPKPKQVIVVRSTGLVPGKCMYWAGVQYQPCSCNVTHLDTPIVELDTVKLIRFKKIDKSTLSKNAVGKTWYAKINGGIEVYSDSGMHPVDTNKRLLRLSGYMLKKYIAHD